MRRAWRKGPSRGLGRSAPCRARGTESQPLCPGKPFASGETSQRKPAGQRRTLPRNCALPAILSASRAPAERRRAGAAGELVGGGKALATRADGQRGFEAFS